MDLKERTNIMALARAWADQADEGEASAVQDRLMKLTDLALEDDRAAGIAYMLFTIIITAWSTVENHEISELAKRILENDIGIEPGELERMYEDMNTMLSELNI